MQSAHVQRSKRPVFSISRSSTEKALDVVAAVGVVCILFPFIFYWSALPDSIPSHFGVSGKPDQWSGKGILWLFPILGVMMGIGLTVASRFPHTFNYLWQITEKNARQQYSLARSMMLWLRTEIIWLFAYIQWGTIQVALGQAEGLGAVFLPVFLVVIFGTVGWYFYQSYRAR